MLCIVSILKVAQTIHAFDIMFRSTEAVVSIENNINIPVQGNQFMFICYLYTNQEDANVLKTYVNIFFEKNNISIHHQHTAVMYWQ